MNLLKNATQAIDPQKQGEIIIATKDKNLKIPMNNNYNSVKAGDYVLLKIADNGKGISFENLKHIFEPFYAQKVTGRKQLGLGMAIVWATIKDHFGYIDVKSKDGEGTAFYIYLPATSKTTITKDTYTTYQSTKNEIVLIVENEENLCKMLAYMLKKLGYNVKTVKSGEHAIKYLNSNPADLVLLNMAMKTELSTLETYRRISKIHSQQKAVLIGGDNETNQVRELQKLGAGTYVKKPYTIDKIGVAIKK